MPASREVSFPGLADSLGWPQATPDEKRHLETTDVSVLNRILMTALLTAAASAAWASSPSLSTILPRGGQRGTEVVAQVYGARIGDANEIVFYDSTIAVSKIEPIDDNNLKITLTIPADARIGEHPVRIRTKSGISELRSFFVGPLPSVEEVEPNSEFDKPQAVPLNCTVNGLAQSEDVDYYVVEAKKGQPIVAEVEGMRLATTLFDPYVAILDAKRFELASSDDSSLALQDPIASVIAPEDGKYIVQVRESSYGGNDSCRYRVHIGTYPRPSVPFPLGGKVGETLEVRWLGDKAGEFTQPVALPTTTADRWNVVPVRNGEAGPSPGYIRISDLRGVNEVEPNNGIAEGTKGGDAPLAFNGIIQTPGDTDFFKFTAKAGQVFDINLYARRLRSPLDPVLHIYNTDGGYLAGVDDSIGPDSYIRFTAPADGEFTLYVHDHLQKGGPDFAYRLEVAPLPPLLPSAFRRSPAHRRIAGQWRSRREIDSPRWFSATESTSEVNFSSPQTDCQRV